MFLIAFIPVLTPHLFASLSRKPTVPLIPVGLTVSCQQSGGIVGGYVIM